MGVIKNQFWYILLVCLISCGKNNSNELNTDKEYVNNADVNSVSVNLLPVKWAEDNNLYSFYYPTSFLMNGRATLYKFGYVLQLRESINIFVQEKCLGDFDSLSETSFLGLCIEQKDTAGIGMFHEIKQLEKENVKTTSYLLMSKNYRNKTILYTNDYIQAIQSFYPSSISSHASPNEGEQKIKLIIDFETNKMILDNLEEDAFLLPYW